MSLFRKMLPLIGVAALGFPAEGARPPWPTPEDRIYRKISTAREQAGGGELERRAELDAAARARAREIGSRPAHRRLAGDVPIGRFLEQGGGRYRRATERLILLKNVPLVDGVLERWRAQTGAWQTLTTAPLDGVGLGTWQAGDGWVVFVAILVRDLVVRDSPGEIAAMEAEVLARINRIREDHDLPALTPVEEIGAVARAHSRDMVHRGFFGHDAPSGTRPSGRVLEAGLTFKGLAENLTMNNDPEDPAGQAVRDWMSSPNHRKNILNGEFVTTGIGLAVAEDGRYFFTQLFLIP